MSAALLLLAAVAVQAQFGWWTARRFLRDDSALFALGMASIFGVSVYMEAVNALGYLLPIRSAFLLGLLSLPLLQLCGEIVVWRTGRAPLLLWPSRSFLITLIVVALVCGFATARFLTTDGWTWGQVSLSATIIDGNFPPREPPNPFSPLGYHYGPQLLGSAYTALSGASLAVTYNVQPFIGALALVFLCAALLFLLRKRPFVAMIGTFCLLGGTGLEWFHGAALLRALWQAYVLHQPSAHPFAELSNMFGNSFAPSVAIIFGSRTFTYGWPMLFGFFYAFHRACTVSALRFRWGLVACVFLVSLGLTMETSLVLLYPVCAVYWLLQVQEQHWHLSRSVWQRFGLYAAIFVPALFFALIQGGVLTQIFHPSPSGEHSFAFGFDGHVGFTSDGHARMALWDPQFLMAVGFPFFLIPVVLVYSWKRRREQPLLLFIAMLALVQTLVPIFITYVPRQNDILRVLYVGYGLFAMLLSVMLAETWLLHRGWRRFLGWAVVVGMLCSTVLYLIVRSTIPTMRFEAAPLFASLPPITQAERDMYTWVRSHSVLSDYFYNGTLTGENYDYPEEVSQQRDRILFMTNTGRYSVGFLLWGNVSPAFVQAGKDIEMTCSLDAFQTLRIHYLVNETPARAAWFGAHCHPNDWSLVYDPSNGTATSPRIYERKGWAADR